MFFLKTFRVACGYVIVDLSFILVCGCVCFWTLFSKVVLTIFSSFCNHLVEEERELVVFTLP